MKLRHVLSTIVIIKLIVIVILKVFFFPDFLKQHAENNESEYVATQILNQ